MNPIRPRHGGAVTSASERFQIPVDQWLDLSTGINPRCYPVPPIPEQCFHRLPENGDREFVDAVDRYYGSLSWVAANGSQRLIEVLPTLREPGRVLLPDVGYQEHHYHWALNQHTICRYDAFQPQTIGDRLDTEAIDVAVVINPCNPTAAVLPRELLLSWCERLAARGGWLVVDEAFIDQSPAMSLADVSDMPGLIVLRSLGKFFGLAGLRVGFVLSGREIHGRIAAAIGPWVIAGPSQYVATRALTDHDWQVNNRQQLSACSQWMYDTLAATLNQGIERIVNGGLFVSLVVDEQTAKGLYRHLANAGILIRYWQLPGDYGASALLRFGLIAEHDNAARQRFLQSLKAFIAAPVA